MYTKKKLVRSTNAQIRFLVDYMSTNPDFAMGHINGTQTVKNIDMEWRSLKGKLDEYGPHKTIDQWRQTWKDLKKKARHEEANALQARINNSTSTIMPKVSDISVKILDTIGYESYIGRRPEDFSMKELELVQDHKDDEVSQIKNGDDIEILIVSQDQQSTHTPQTPIDSTPGRCNSRNEDQVATPTQSDSSSGQPTNSRTVPDSSKTVPRRVSRVGQRKYRPFDRSSEFLGIEQRRLRLEHEYNTQHLELEKERLRLDALRVEQENARLQVEAERVQVEAERVRVEAERVRVEQGRLENEKALREVLEQYHDYMQKLLLRSMPLLDSAKSDNSE